MLDKLTQISVFVTCRVGLDYTWALRQTKGFIVRLGILLIWCVFLAGQSTAPRPAPKAKSPADTANQKSQKQELGLRAAPPGCGQIDILSDTQGVDFGPYLQLVVSRVRENWYHLIPDSATLKKGKVVIEFAVTKDGKTADMRLALGSGDVDLDHAAWGGITSSNPFPPLPSDFAGPYLALRWHFCYNPEDTKAKSGITVGISKPDDLNVPVGGSEVITAAVTGTNENALEWSVTGSGCSGSACGKMSENLYLAPSVLPDPPLVTVTAVSKADPTARASVTLHIVKATPH